MLFNDEILCGCHRLGPPAFAALKSKVTAVMEIQKCNDASYSMLQSICISYKNNNNNHKSIKYQSCGMLWQNMVTPDASYFCSLATRKSFF